VRNTLLFTTIGLFAPCVAQSETFILPPPDIDLVGRMQVAQSRKEDTLLDVARRFDVGQDEILHANPGVDRWLPGEGTEAVIPSRYILPDAPREGIVLNVPEMRMYYYTRSEPDGQPVIVTHPVSIGRMDWNTPLGKTTIVSKTKDPSWRPPESLKEEAAAAGNPLPDMVPPGPDNPLGGYAMRLGVPGYLIHSTNKPYGVGMRVTHGCIRMYPEDIESMFDRVPVNTAVRIVNQPVKLGWLADTLFVEIHPPLDEDRERFGDPLSYTLDLIAAAIETRPVRLDGRAIREAVEEMSGIPVAISR
jgi:L,D-transpeptidase ErfK/SrfK